MPFYIRLRYHINADPSERPHLPTPKDFPSLISSAISDDVPKGWAREKLMSGHAVVLVDGVDEVPEGQRKDVRLWLRDLIGEYPHANFIVTSRPPAVEGIDWVDWLDTEGFQDAVLQSMSLRDIFEFIDHWHAAVAKRLLDEHEKDELPLFAHSLKEELKRNRAKRELATSPLLCAMLCALNRDRQQQLPADRIKLYEACCELLIEQRDKSRSILLRDYPAAALEYSQKLLLLQDLAYWMTRNGKSEIEVVLVDERFHRKLSSIRNLPQNLSGNDGGIYVRKLFVDRSNIIREPIVGRIDFTHRTFQEFLSARAALEEGDIGVLVQNAYNDQWREVVLLASGLASKKVREELVDQLIGQGDTDKAYRTRLHLLAASCLEASVVELGSNVKLRVQKRLSALVPPKNFDEAKALAEAGELAVPHLSRKDTYEPSVRQACVYALGCITGDEALKVLESYAEDTDEDVQAQLWHTWNAFVENNRTAYVQRILSRTEYCLYKNMRPELSALMNDYPSIANFTTLEDIGYCTKLKSLGLTDCQQITDLAPLSGLSQLRFLYLQNCRQITDLAPLSGLSQLRFLYLTDCQQITDLAPLSGLSQLQSLDLTGCQQITDINPLSSLQNLFAVYVNSGILKNKSIPKNLGKIIQIVSA